MDTHDEYKRITSGLVVLLCYKQNDEIITVIRISASNVPDKVQKREYKCKYIPNEKTGGVLRITTNTIIVDVSTVEDATEIQRNNEYIVYHLKPEYEPRYKAALCGITINNRS